MAFVTGLLMIITGVSSGVPFEVPEVIASFDEYSAIFNKSYYSPAFEVSACRIWCDSLDIWRALSVVFGPSLTLPGTHFVFVGTHFVWKRFRHSTITHSPETQTTPERRIYPFLFRRKPGLHSRQTWRLCSSTMRNLTKAFTPFGSAPTSSPTCRS